MDRIIPNVGMDERTIARIVGYTFLEKSKRILLELGCNIILVKILDFM